jgi:ubiquinone/menaquinone biosynthesis C-methylase UbiE
MAQSGNLYADLAGYYDQFCADVDYAEQCEFARRAFACFASSEGRDYLDLACGTGQHLLSMAAHGYICSGLDNSAAMLAQAAQRCPQAQLLLCDLAAFEHQGAFDLITCFLYSIHYSHPTSALEQTLRRAWRALKPGGVFIFNAVDARGIRNHSGITTRLVDGDSQLSFQSGWHYRGEGDVLDLSLRITRESGAGIERWQDHHTMTALTLPALQGMLEESGFEVTLLEHDYQVMAPWSGASFNAIVVACKPLAIQSGQL